MSKRILRSSREINLMRRAGLVVWQAHQAAFKLIRPGVTTAELNRAVADTFRRKSAEPLFLNFPGEIPFPAESCISINEELVHGIPGKRELREGDIVSIDTGCRLNGWCADAAVTHTVGEVSRVASKLLEATKGVLDLAIELMSKEKVWSEVARGMDAFINEKGFSMVRSMVGHGIGKEMHEPPQVRNFYAQETIDDDFSLKPGVVLAVEPMVNVGTEELTIRSDRWTAATKDKQLSAHFEHTIAIVAEGPWRLTSAPSSEELDLVDPEFRQAEEWVWW
ncbi:MAG TPA: type I methionyl aminopeptidase [Pirellulaceae bacterium]|nr:type I methionyl aminopeptidase [Pirellulaceae bacterium]HMO91647.1 type I methionyl aminopeptidase [Pirellulaceae bacterium]HMP68344.1 type I methionyl aminopeptidase [Pirellulaceae bacterium]